MLRLKLGFYDTTFSWRLTKSSFTKLKPEKRNYSSPYEYILFLRLENLVYLYGYPNSLTSSDPHGPIIKLRNSYRQYAKKITITKKSSETSMWTCVGMMRRNRYLAVDFDSYPIHWQYWREAQAMNQGDSRNVLNTEKSQSFLHGVSIVSNNTQSWAEQRA